MGLLDIRRAKKVSALLAAHSSLNRSDIVPIAFCTSGHIHPSALVFIDWFLRTAPHEPLNAAPSNEKLKLLHAIQGAIVEKTASLLSAHFHRYISAHHTALFPHFILRLPSAYTPAARRRAVRSRQSYPSLPTAASPPPSQSSDFADTTIPLDSLSSQSSAGGLPLPILSSPRRPVAAPPLPTPHPAPTASTTRASRLAGGLVHPYRNP